MLLRLLLVTLAIASSARCADLAEAIPRTSRQLVVVTTESWIATRASLQRYARSKATDAWRPVGPAMPALIGERGLAWGRGLHAIPTGADRIKREGDRCAPAGIFRIGRAFGQLSARELGPLRVPYLQISPGWEAVDDPLSRHYNRIVDRNQFARPDWQSSERLWDLREYRLALEVGHNPRPIPGAGSCIFIHEWIGARNGTAGCTVLRRADLHTLAGWLEATAAPVLLQAPRREADLNAINPPAR